MDMVVEEVKRVSAGALDAAAKINRREYYRQVRHLAHILCLCCAPYVAWSILGASYVLAPSFGVHTLSEQ